MQQLHHSSEPLRVSCRPPAPQRQGRLIIERRMGEEYTGSIEGGFRPKVWYLYAKKVHRSNQRWADTGVGSYYWSVPITGHVDVLMLSPGSQLLPLVAFHPQTDTSSRPLAFVPPPMVSMEKPISHISAASSPSPHSSLLSFSVYAIHVNEEVHTTVSSHSSIPHPVSILPLLTVRSSLPTLPTAPKEEKHVHSELRDEHHSEDPGLLMHLDVGRVDKWFAYRLGAHRHEDDVDHNAEKHAIEEEMHLLVHEIAEAVHHHLQTLHHDFASWWVHWHGHEGEVAVAAEEKAQEEARALEEHIDGQDHDLHDQTFGRHVAEWYWRLMHEWGLDATSLHAHGTLPHVLHAEWFHRHDLGSEATEVAEMDDYNGWRHGFHSQANIWWMYHGHPSEHVLATVAEAHAAPSDTPRDWRAIELGVSAYDPPVRRTLPLMAGHEVPPSE